MEFDDVYGVGGGGVLLDEPVAGFFAFFDEVGADEGFVEGGVGGVDGAVGEDDGDAGVFGFFEDGVPAGLDDGGEGDDVDLLLDEGADGFDLVFLFLLGVGEFEVDSGLFGRVLDRLGVRGAPAGLRADLGEPECDLPVVRAGARTVTTAAGGQRAGQRGGQQDRRYLSPHFALLVIAVSANISATASRRPEVCLREC
ncbi:hypothetical protein Psuf_050830 [Phytohabitans suffuscus]|uniref:Uncharacterized protein n=1 Tax=Phytohabitans suffuscus TaxID=624315 RepID=A0A6F8YNS4_9ACTN|nr:hypothetical protein Psuf_050830 [Phytohabitans suffuscus]